MIHFTTYIEKRNNGYFDYNVTLFKDGALQELQELAHHWELYHNDEYMQLTFYWNNIKVIIRTLYKENKQTINVYDHNENVWNNCNIEQAVEYLIIAIYPGSVGGL